MNHWRQMNMLGARQLRSTDAKIFNVTLMNPSHASFMFVAL